MRKFIKKLAFFILISALIVGLVNFAYVKLDRSDRYNTDKYSSMPDHIEICNLGSSHTLYGISYEDVKEEYNCFNFALESQTLSYDLRLLEQYKDRIVSGAIVIIPVSYPSFFGPDETELSDFQSKNKRYYSILESKYVKGYDFSTDLFVHYLPALSVDTGILVKALMGKRTKSHFDETRSRTLYDIDLAENAENAYNRHFTGFIYDDAENLQVNTSEIQALKDIIQICNEIQAKPVLITTPLHESYLEHVKNKKPDFLPQFHAIVERIVAETDIDYFDYSMDERFIHSPELFMDADHLNGDGALKFTDLLLENIR